jgi:lysozyme family protein
MMADYQQTIERIINDYEGGYGWDKGDPGGPTKFGITCYDLAEHRHERMTSMAAWAPIVRAMSLKEADDIYQTKYAQQCDYAGLGAGCDAVVLDFGINSGSSRSIKFSQEIVRVPVDGQLGPQTQDAINAYGSIKFINALCDARMNFLRRLGTFSTFGRGWTARVRDLRSYATHLAVEADKPPGALEMPKKEKFEEKHKRIHLAFAKAYHKEDLAALKAHHGSD